MIKILALTLAIGTLAVADLVVARPPEGLADWLDQRRYFLTGAPLIKRVASLPGRKICPDGSDISVDGIVMARARERDHLGRPLAARRRFILLHPDQIFFSTRTSQPRSTDATSAPFRSKPSSVVPVRWTRKDN
jgi:type IV secretory pathway protease TraF